MLRDGLPIDELMREQARDGRFGALGEGGEDDIEIEVARRVAALRTEPAGAVLPQFTPDGAEVGLHVEVVPDGGGLVLVLAGLRAWQPAAMPETQPAGRPASAVPVYVTVEW